MITTQRAVAACLAGGLFLLSACSADPAQPRTLDSLSPSATASPSPTASPSLSLEAQAEEAVRSYYATATEALATRKTDALRAKSVSTCGCRALLKYIEDKWSSGSLVGGRFEVAQVQLLGTAADLADVRVVYSVPSYEVRDTSGRRIETVPAESGESIVRLLRSPALGYLFAEVRPV